MNLRDILDSDTVRRIRFGGIVGKLTIITVCWITASAFMFKVAQSPLIQILVACFFAGGFFLIVGFIAFYCTRNPHHATLEGSEILAFAQMQLASKGKSATYSQTMLQGMKGGHLGNDVGLRDEDTQ